MSQKIQDEYKKFNDIAKLMNKADISTVPETLSGYRLKIVPAYNNFIKFIDANYERVVQKDQYILDSYLEKSRALFIVCLDKLKCSFELPNDLRKQVEFDSIGEINSQDKTEKQSKQSEIKVTENPKSTDESESKVTKNPKSSDESESKVTEVSKSSDELESEVTEDSESDDELSENSKTNKVVELKETEKDNSNISQIPSTSKQSNSENTTITSNKSKENSDKSGKTAVEVTKVDNNTANNLNNQNQVPIDNNWNNQNQAPIVNNRPIMDSLNLFNAVNRQFKQNYSGDPLGLTSFTDGVNILLRFANTPELRADLFEFIRAKLDGRAREFITDDVNTVELLLAKLQQNILPENSKVIEGRIASLRYAYSRQEDFADKAEQLAGALRRTHIIEGMTANKANEISVDRTVQLCRKSTNSDLVKSVLASTAFNSPKEVIAKLITESDTYVKEQQVLRLQRVPRNVNNRGVNRNMRENVRNFRNQNFNNQNGNYQNNNFGRRNGNHRGRFNPRGRGNGHQNRNYHQNNNPPNQNYGNDNNYGQNIRLAQAGNEPVPQQINMGAQNH